MSCDVPKSTRLYARENRETMEYIGRYGSSVEIRTNTEALLIRGLSIPELNRVIDELEISREVLN